MHCGYWFDLNYVGCELKSFDGTLSVKLNAFDLNYVGCEQVCSSSMIRDNEKFDLNYVGCEPWFGVKGSVKAFQV